MTLLTRDRLTQTVEHDQERFLHYCQYTAGTPKSVDRIFLAAPIERLVNKATTEAVKLETPFELNADGPAIVVRRAGPS